jgi:hypothetical protein
MNEASKADNFPSKEAKAPLRYYKNTEYESMKEEMIKWKGLQLSLYIKLPKIPLRPHRGRH